MRSQQRCLVVVANLGQNLANKPEALTMIRIEAAPQLETLSRAFRELERKQLPFAMALAATRTAQRVRKGELAVMRQRLHNPTNTTMNSLFLTSAKKGKPEARVWFKDQFGSGIPADRYLQAIVQGGPRRHKRMEKALIARGIMSSNEYAMPTPALMDAHGNVKGSIVMKILSGLGAAETVSGVTANASNSRRSRKKGNAQRFFVAEIEGTRGIWERKTIGMAQGIRPVYVFVQGAPQYRVVVPFFKIAANIVKANYEKEFTTALEQAIATARP